MDSKRSPYKGVFRWSFARAREHMKGLLLGVALLTLASGALGAVVQAPENADNWEKAGYGAATAAAILLSLFVAGLLYALVRAPLEQRNELRGEAAGLTSELKELAAKPDKAPETHIDDLRATAESMSRCVSADSEVASSTKGEALFAHLPELRELVADWNSAVRAADAARSTYNALVDEVCDEPVGDLWMAAILRKAIQEKATMAVRDGKASHDGMRLMLEVSNWREEDEDRFVVVLRTSRTHSSGTSHRFETEADAMAYLEAVQERFRTVYESSEALAAVASRGHIDALRGPTSELLDKVGIQYSFIYVNADCELCPNPLSIRVK